MFAGTWYVASRFQGVFGSTENTTRSFIVTAEMPNGVPVMIRVPLLSKLA